MATAGTSGLAGEDARSADEASPRPFAHRLTDRLDELRSNQALHDELTATRRYMYRLPAPPERISPEDLLRTLDAMLTQLAEVVGRLQDTIETQGRLLDRVARSDLAIVIANTGDRTRALPAASAIRDVRSRRDVAGGCKSGVKASRDQG